MYNEYFNSTIDGQKNVFNFSVKWLFEGAAGTKTICESILQL